MVRVPKNLVARIPENVDDKTASFTVVGAIALQGIRLISPNVGETVVVMGLGLIGLMAIQILKANGCKVIGIDHDSGKCKIAKKYGVDVVDLSSNKDSVSLVAGYAKHKGVDAVLITASSKSNDIIHDAATMCRKRGKIVLVGVVGLDLRRDDFYEKELTFQVSCSYGPGRYDQTYEQMGIDYPEAYVRWTEQRNFEAILNLMSNKLINVDSLVSSEYPIEDYNSAYDDLNKSDVLGILLNYKNREDEKLTETSILLNKSKKPGGSIVSFVGSGNYASKILIPAFKKSGATLDVIVTSE